MAIKNFLFRIISLFSKKGAGISAQQAFQEIQSDKAILVDVREKEELLQEGMAAPARWMPTSEIQSKTDRWKKFVNQLPKDKKIIVYCAAGVRAGRFANELTQAGFTTANLGGFEEWAREKLPVKPFQSV